MNIDDFKNIEMTPDEKLEAVFGLKKNMEENFVTLGHLLSEIKRNNLFKFKGYKTFKEFVENEYNFSGSFANKLVSNYNVFIYEFGVDEKTAKEIGLDKLNMIKPMLKEASQEEAIDWIRKAEEVPTAELREEIKEIRDLKKEQERTMKDVFVEQYFERMVTAFNCSKKELEYKLALFFQDSNLDEIKDAVREKQKRYEDVNN
ncbi:MAG: hypothetical protein KAS49_01585 [Candidatus Cloacimonetes bacterium]|nr:hypothetical protein [Candidatus Cloacimonadota bacterium]